MKRAKKTLALVLCAMMVMMTFAACGGKDMSGSKFCGKWAASTATMSGIEVDASEVYEGGFIIELGTDGKCTVTTDGESETGSWDESEDGTQVIIDGMDDFKIYLDPDDENVLKLDYSGMIINFEKQ